MALAAKQGISHDIQAQSHQSAWKDAQDQNGNAINAQYTARDARASNLMFAQWRIKIHHFHNPQIIKSADQGGHHSNYGQGGVLCINQGL